MRAALVVAVALALGLVLAACGGSVAPSGSDAAPDVAEDAPEDAPAEVATFTCPTYRPLRNLPCSPGLTCDYPCAPGYTTSMRATCPSGRWVLTTTGTCP